jgi:hypothetical protein
MSEVSLTRGIAIFPVCLVALEHALGDPVCQMTSTARMR